jgi:hypothetical protein
MLKLCVKIITEQSRAEQGRAEKQSCPQSHAKGWRSVTAEVRVKYVLYTRERVTDKRVAGLIPSHYPLPIGNYAIVYI